MFDEQGGTKSGYRLEYARSGRSKCSGPTPCKGTTIERGELRFGSLVNIKGITCFQWRHWRCVTARILTNAKKSLNDADELDGFEDLDDEDQERIKKAWDMGHVPPEDVTETAMKGDGEDEENDAERQR
ncbi:zf-PARP-domain-containing protein [Polyporus arcularius HHB13444]|uniref:Zf-PARP-domain-containing protein n=1 Tax=Polyporus arcularius HHB13444 TaxID=1314778 RepID=A0A5C3NV90_9APHY|nr:zf-PARP-domain-containing protein [Polyporus arcularius HHB13444]